MSNRNHLVQLETIDTKSAFVVELTESIQGYFHKQPNGIYATPFVWLKALMLIVLFFSLYVTILLADVSSMVRLSLVIGWGIVSLLIVFNIGHDSVHGSFSRYPVVNRLLSYSFNLVGANAYSWKLKHNLSHHQHTNIEGLDHDTEMDPLMRVSPFSRFRWHYRWQHWYWPFVYGLFSLLIVFVLDFLIFMQMKNGTKYKFYQPVHEWIILFLTKGCYLVYCFWIPVYVAGFTLNEVLIGFFTMHVVNGVLIGLIFQPSHYFVDSKFYRRSDPRNWYEGQLLSAMDISPQNKVLSQLIGSLNINVAHHLYPRICHVHYPALSELIFQMAEKYSLSYYRMDFSKAISSHVALLRKLSKF